jgi:hypothetical protein
MNIFKKSIFGTLLTIFCLAYSIPLQAAHKKSTAYQSHQKTSKKPYVKKSAYQGFGKKSTVNGKYKTKIVQGHIKRTKKGYTYVNPYAKSDKGI